MNKAGYTYSQCPTSELTILWNACLKPGGKASILLPGENGRSKVPGGWVTLDHAIRNRESFFVNLPHHLVAIDLDSPMPEDGTGQKVLDYLNGQDIYFVVATSGSSGWVIVINLWTTLTGSENKADYLTQNFDKKVEKLKQELEALSPDQGWASRVRRNIRPPLSPYPFSGALRLISPSTVTGAAKILNYGGVITESINPHPESLARAINLTDPREIRATHFMSLANVMTQAGYHFEDFKEILRQERTPIGNLYNKRILEYKRDFKWIEKDLANTWEKSFKFVQQNPPMGEARRLIPEWVLFAWATVIQSNYPSSTKTRLIACIFAIASISYSACTLNPVIGEKRLTAVSGVSKKSIWRYKKILNNLGLVTVSFEETPESVKNYGTMFSIQVSSVSFTDIGSLLITTMGNRDRTSVNRVNDLDIKHQITHLIKSWQPDSLWLTERSGRVNGHVLWVLLDSFPNLNVEQISNVLGWSRRTTLKALGKLQVISLIYMAPNSSEWCTYSDPAHWNDLNTLPKVAFQ